jgi:ribosome-associated protein
VERFIKLIQNALIVQKKRIPTKLSKSKQKRRMKEKKRHSEKKKERKRINKYDY